jgi:hypothetical protein
MTSANKKVRKRAKRESRSREPIRCHSRAFRSRVSRPEARSRSGKPVPARLATGRGRAASGGGARYGSAFLLVRVSTNMTDAPRHSQKRVNVASAYTSTRTKAGMQSRSAFCPCKVPESVSQLPIVGTEGGSTHLVSAKQCRASAAPASTSDRTPNRFREGRSPRGPVRVHAIRGTQDERTIEESRAKCDARCTMPKGPAAKSSTALVLLAGVALGTTKSTLLVDELPYSHVSSFSLRATSEFAKRKLKKE